LAIPGKTFTSRLKKQEQQQFIEEIVIKIVMRKEASSKTGILKTYHLIKQELIKQNIKIGRDKLADILRDNNLLVKRKRSYTKTTITNKWRNIYDDLRVDFTPTASEQLWCADITYIRTNKGFEYLSLITDEYSKYIVGGVVSQACHTTGCYKALQMALQQCHYPQRKLVHHSDRVFNIARINTPQNSSNMTVLSV
jgi:putative transposase